MSREETARVALRRLARGTDSAHGFTGPGADSADWLPSAASGGSSNDCRPPETESSQPRSDADDAVPTVVRRAVAAVGDLDAAARFVDDGGVDALATALVDRRRPVSASEPEEGIDALRAFCAYERAAARGRSPRPEAAGASPTSGTGTEDGTRDGAVDVPDGESADGPGASTPSSTSAADSPHL